MTNDAVVTGSGERRSSNIHDSEPVRLISRPGEVRNLRCDVIDGQAIFEGDIVIRRALETLGVGITGERFRWPNRTIVYDLDASLSADQRAKDAIAHWQGHTLMQFKRRSNENDYVVFRSGGGCSSSVGKVGGVQFVTLGPDCGTGNAIHEIGHTAGLWHEQSREDRDAYVRIEWANIDPDMKHNFDQQIADGDDIGDYDYGSIMHYPKDAFAIDQSKPTIVPLQNHDIGQRKGLSDGDIKAIAWMYP